MLIQFFWENPPEEEYLDLPERNADPNTESPERNVIPVGICFYDTTDTRIWFVADLPECPQIGSKVFVPRNTMQDILTVHQVFIDAGIKDRNIIYQCFCSAQAKQICQTCFYWESVDGYEGTCLITSKTQTKEEFRTCGRARIEVWDEDGESVKIANDTEDGFAVSLTTEYAFGCSRWQER